MKSLSSHKRKGKSRIKNLYKIIIYVIYRIPVADFLQGDIKQSWIGAGGKFIAQIADMLIILFIWKALDQNLE